MNTAILLGYGVFAYAIGAYVGHKRVTFGKALDLNVLAKTVTMLEGKKKSLPIAQVKEVIARTFDVLSRHSKDVIYLTVKKNN